jgi:hypothetical protein
MYFDMMEIADWFHITNTPYAMPHRERLNNANGAKRVTDSFGHSNIFATLSPLVLQSETKRVRTLNIS